VVKVVLGSFIFASKPASTPNWLAVSGKKRTLYSEASKGASQLVITSIWYL